MNAINYYIHDVRLTRLKHFWEEVKDLVTPEFGFLIIDDTVLDKPCSKYLYLVYRQWSGKPHQIINGINLETVVWTSNYAIIPVDFRIYDLDTYGKTKNYHFLDLLNKAVNAVLDSNLFCLYTWYSIVNAGE